MILTLIKFKKIRKYFHEEHVSQIKNSIPTNILQGGISITHVQIILSAPIAHLMKIVTVATLIFHSRHHRKWSLYPNYVKPILH